MRFEYLTISKKNPSRKITEIIKGKFSIILHLIKNKLLRAFKVYITAFEDIGSCLDTSFIILFNDLVSLFIHCKVWLASRGDIFHSHLLLI